MILNNVLLMTLFINKIMCRDFYAGMFKKNDFLVAQDRLYKEKVPYKYMYAKYGRIFNCPITYFRVADRLGVGNGPQVQIVRGGIRYKYLVLRLRSAYNLPISVNIYVGCENKMTTTKTTSTPTKLTSNTNTGNGINTEEHLKTTAADTGESKTENGVTSNNPTVVTTAAN